MDHSIKRFPSIRHGNLVVLMPRRQLRLVVSTVMALLMASPPPDLLGMAWCRAAAPSGKPACCQGSKAGSCCCCRHAEADGCADEPAPCGDCCCRAVGQDAAPEEGVSIPKEPAPRSPCPFCPCCPYGCCWCWGGHMVLDGTMAPATVIPDGCSGSCLAEAALLLPAAPCHELIRPPRA